MHSNISDISQTHQNQNNALNHSQHINLLNVHRNTEKTCLKPKKVRTTEENHTYQAFYCSAHDDYLHIKSQELRKNS